jgi:hypothetical protein
MGAPTAADRATVETVLLVAGRLEAVYARAMYEEPGGGCASSGGKRETLAEQLDDPPEAAAAGLWLPVELWLEILAIICQPKRIYQPPLPLTTSFDHFHSQMHLCGDSTRIQLRQGQHGTVIEKTKTAMIIGAYSDGVQAGTASMIVAQMSDYLIDQGY